jgi:uncharacterized protein
MMQCRFFRLWAIFTAVTLMAVCSSSRAEPSETEINIASGAVVTIKKSLADRYRTLIQHFETGVIGFTDDGLIALRDGNGLPGEARSALDSLVADDNKDRATLYREIARVNGRPDWESHWRKVFAQRWIDRAPAGWYYRNGSRWIKKS